MIKYPLKRLADVAEINPRRVQHDRKDDEPTSFVPMENVNEVWGEIIQLNTVPYSKAKRGYTYFQDGDVIFAKITPCMQNGKHAIVQGLIGGFGFGSTEFHVIRASKEIIPEWIHFFLRRKETLDAAIRTFTGAVGQQRVPANFIANLEIPVPPVDAQRRIAAQVKAQLAEVQKARQAAETQLAELNLLPQKILAAAFEGAAWS